MAEDQAPPMSRPRVAAGALFFDDVGRVLLVKPTYKAGWDIPGGYVEPGETPIEACEREIKEELGLSRAIRELLVVDWAPSAKEGDKILFVFDGGSLTDDELDSIHLPAAELSEHAFHSLDSLGDALNGRLTRRITAAAAAHQDGVFSYLEHGTPPQSEGDTAGV